MSSATGRLSKETAVIVQTKYQSVSILTLVSIFGSVRPPLQYSKQNSNMELDPCGLLGLGHKAGVASYTSLHSQL